MIGSCLTIPCYLKLSIVIATLRFPVISVASNTCTNTFSRYDNARDDENDDDDVYQC
jgi:hypothetical protein